MRIVAGRWKGRPLTAPKGQTTRPTSERAREAVFNILTHAPWAPSLEGARVIDLFAGAGALGFEALSRGAAFALFVETDAAARGAIRATIEAVHAFGVTRIHRRDATDLGLRPAGLGAPFDIAFLDPPYQRSLTAPALIALRDGGWLAPGAAVVSETGADEPCPSVEGFATQDERTYGAAKITFLTAPA